MTDTLVVEWGAHDVLTLTLNRPERRNALDPELLGLVAEVLRTEGERAGAIILRGAGDEAFSSGYDLSHLTGSLEDLDADRYIGDAATALRMCPAPVIARLRGHCHGGAVELEQLAAEHTDVKIAKVNVDEEPALAERYRVRGIPYVALFRDGKLASQVVGYRPKAALESGLGLNGTKA